MTRFGVFLLAALFPVTMAARADDQVLSPQTHREAWNSYSGDVIKDFEWTVKPTISSSNGSTSVHVDESVTKHADGFAGVTGEIEFSYDAFQSIEVQFADGTVNKVQSGDANFTGDAAAKKIAKITANFELVGRKWALSWDVGGVADAGSDNLPGDWSAATSTPPPAVAPVDATPKKGTWLTVTEIKDRSQDLDGIWRESGGDEDPGQEMQWFHHLDDKLTVGLLADRREGSWVRLVKAGDSNRWEGQGAPPGEEGTGFSICPRPKGTCTQLCKWAAGFLNIEPGALHITGEWDDKQIDSTNCTFTDQPQTQAENFDRFVGVSFAPLLPGKYLYMGMAPAVGNQPAQFKALVRIAAHYAGTGAVEIKTTVDPATGTLARTGGDVAEATYEFTTTGHGVFELSFDLTDKDGTVFHTDRVRIEIPTVPGIGN